jgi:putative DNA base modification enzyme with NMAD domain
LNAIVGSGIVNALLIRIGADQSKDGGRWNGPVDAQSGKFVYVPIPEQQPVNAGMEKPYSALAPVLSMFGINLPPHLCAQHMHLDPDFYHLTYGDRGKRAKQIRDYLAPGDLVVFYAGLFDICTNARLVYAIVGVLVVESFRLAIDVPPTERDINAHSRRVLKPDAQDLIVCAKPGVSGRLECCVQIGEWRDRAYRVKRDLLEKWGGLSVKDGYLQRSARLPKFCDPVRFQSWFESKEPTLLQVNN